MATNRNLRLELLNRLDVTPQRLSQRVSIMKQEHGPMSTEEATYVIAHMEGLDLSRFLNEEIVKTVRGLVPRSSSRRQHSRNVTKKKSGLSKGVTIKIVGKLPKVDAFLTTTIAKDAKDMAELYPLYYMLENSLRIVISRILSAKHGKHWWKAKTSKTLQLNVEQRKKKEATQPWHGKRGQHEIYYSNFGDLSSIIQKNWGDFKDFFPTRPWIIQKLEELEHPRNVMAHHNPVDKTDLKRIEVYYNDWFKLLDSKKSTIP